MTDTRTRYTAEYLYPGVFMPEEFTKPLDEPTFAAAVAAGPDEENYFVKDGWYAVRITATHEKRFVSEDGEEAWVRQSSEKAGSWIVGQRVHYSDIEATDRNAILISNIRGNSRDGGFGVLTRCGNWQIASDYTEVIEPAAAKS